MASDLTRVRQQTEVGEGLAVGCLITGVTALGEAASLDEALVHALGSWPWATRYPALRRTPRLGEVLRQSSGRRGATVAQWVASQGLFVPQLRDDDWDLTGAAARLEEVTSVPARRWVELAATFVSGLDEASVWRARPVDPLESL